MEEETVAPLVKILATAAGGNGTGSDRLGASASGTGIVQGGVGLQLLYHVLLVFWELTFEEVIAEEINQCAIPFTVSLWHTQLTKAAIPGNMTLFLPYSKSSDLR